MRYWIHVDGKTEGPFAPEQLRKLAAFTADTLVCPEGAKGGNDWSPARGRPELEEVVRAIPKRFWIIDDTRTPKGPLDVDQLKKLKGLLPTTLACPIDARGSEDWKPASEFDALKPLFGAGEAPAEAPAPKPFPAFPSPAFSTPASQAEAAPAAAPAPRSSSLSDFFTEPPPSDLPPVAAEPPAGVPAAAPPAAFAALGDPAKRKILVPAVALVFGVLAAAAALGRKRILSILHRAPESSAAPASAPAEAASREADAIEFAQAYPLRGGAAALYPTNLYQIGSASKKRWLPLRKLADRFRYEPYRIAWELTQAYARARGVSGDDAQREVNAKIQAWHGLDAAYKVAWSAAPQGGGRYRVEAKVENNLSFMLEQALHAPSSGAKPQETHDFLVDLDAKTLEAASPEAEADLRPAAPQAAARPRGGRRGAPPKARGARRAAPKAETPEPAVEPEVPATPPDESEIGSPLSTSEEELPGIPKPKSLTPTPDAPAPAPPRAAPKLSPGASRTDAKRQARDAELEQVLQGGSSSPPSGRGTAAPPSGKSGSDSRPDQPPPQSKSKPATEMSVDELEKYLERK